METEEVIKYLSQIRNLQEEKSDLLDEIDRLKAALARDRHPELSGDLVESMCNEICLENPDLPAANLMADAIKEWVEIAVIAKLKNSKLELANEELSGRIDVALNSSNSAWGQLHKILKDVRGLPRWVMENFDVSQPIMDLIASLDARVSEIVNTEYQT